MENLIWHSNMSDTLTREQMKKITSENQLPDCMASLCDATTACDISYCTCDANPTGLPDDPFLYICVG